MRSQELAGTISLAENPLTAAKVRDLRHPRGWWGGTIRTHEGLHLRPRPRAMAIPLLSKHEEMRSTRVYWILYGLGPNDVKPALLDHSQISLAVIMAPEHPGTMIVTDVIGKITGSHAQ